MENRLKAEQFAAEYDRLKDLASSHAEEQQGPLRTDDFWNLALAVFGMVLGAGAVMAILHEIFDE